jgi:hypothetical protein
MRKLSASSLSEFLCAYCLGARELSWEQEDGSGFEMRACPACCGASFVSLVCVKSAMEAAVAAFEKALRSKKS